MFAALLLSSEFINTFIGPGCYFAGPSVGAAILDQIHCRAESRKAG